MDRVDALCERARSLAEVGVPLEEAVPELLGIARGERWVVEAALSRSQDTAALLTEDSTGHRAVSLLRSLLTLGVLH